MKSAARRKTQAGMSLMELIVVITILSALSAMVHATSRVQTHAFLRETARVTTQSDLRIWLARMARDIRQSGYDPLETGLFNVETISGQEIRLHTDTNENGVVDAGASENVGYRLSSGVLQRWKGGTSWRPVLFGVDDLQIVYRNADGDVTSVVTDVSMVEIVLSATPEVGAVPGQAGRMVSQTTTAEIRNALY